MPHSQHILLARTVKLKPKLNFEKDVSLIINRLINTNRFNSVFLHCFIFNLFFRILNFIYAKINCLKNTNTHIVFVQFFGIKLLCPAEITVIKRKIRSNEKCCEIILFIAPFIFALNIRN